MFLKDNKFARGLSAASTKLKHFGAGIAALGKEMLLMDAAQLALFGLAAREFGKMGADLKDFSDRTGIAVEPLSELAFAATHGGSTVEDLDSALGKMAKTLSAADEESKKAVAALAALGIQVEDLQGLSPDEQFSRLAEAITDLEDPNKKAAAAMEVFGKAGRKLLPMLAELDDLRKKGREMGVVWTQEMVDRADAFDDSLQHIGQQLHMTVGVIGAGVVPALQNFIDVIGRALASVIAWIKENEDVVEHIFVTTAAFVAFDLAVFTVGKVLWGVGVVLGIVTAAIGALVSVVSFLLSPLGLVTAGLGALVVGLIHASDVAQEAFGAIGTVAKTTLAGIGDAITAGKWELAARIAWAGLKAAFGEGVIALKALWQEFTGWFTEAFHIAVTGLLMLMQDLWVGLRLGLLEIRSAAIETVKQLDKLNPFTGKEWAQKEEAAIARDRANIRAQRDDADRNLLRFHDRMADARAAERQAELDRFRQGIAAEMAELEQLRGEAGRAKAALVPAGRLEQVAGTPVALRKAAVAGVRGTVDPARIQSALAFGTDKVDEKQLAEQEKIRKGVDKIAAAAVGGGMMFWK